MEKTETSLREWREFFGAFRREIVALGWTALESGWSASANRTEYYLAEVLPRVASSLGLRWAREQYSVDFTMVTDAGVPWAFVESENEVGTAHAEVGKLCCLAGPVRVLISVSEWDSGLGGWTHLGHRAVYLPAWQNMVAEYSKVWPRDGVLGIIIGERGRDETIRFYAYVLGPDGEVIERADPAFKLAPSVLEPAGRN